MYIRKTYWIASLSLLLSFSLTLPYCCHADISELFSHQQEMPSSMMHGGDHQDAQQCDCGHEFVKDFQKTKKVADSQTFSLSSAIVLSNRLSFTVSADLPVRLVIQPGILSDAGPPIHLLNSVFLN